MDVVMAASDRGGGVSGANGSPNKLRSQHFVFKSKTALFTRKKFIYLVASGSKSLQSFQ
jgi:hypothetical protein